MDRSSIFFLNKNDSNTYDFDELLPPLPLPDLHETLQRYFESIKPFGTPDELKNSQNVIKNFEEGVGKDLHILLKQRAANEKNWVDEWWDKYAYHMLRLPLNPYIVMAMPVNLEVINLPESPEHMLKNLSQLIYYTLEFWDLLHKAAIKPLSSNGGRIKYSSVLYKRFFSTTRVPGVEFDYIIKHFKTVNEGKTPSHGLISGKGRLFIFDCIHADKTIITPQEILILLQQVRAILDSEPMGNCLAVLTHDDRTSWAINYQRLKEISVGNNELLKLVESSSIVIAFDENEPQNYEEVSRFCIYGDYHSKWGDRSSTIIAFKSGRFAYVGEHSAYDGTVSGSYALYIQLSILEMPEPDWNTIKSKSSISLSELKFELNDELRKEIDRVMRECDRRRNDITITYDIFDDFGKDLIKTWNLHPDSFVQVVMQLAYADMHSEIAPTYETALMRHYYNGRTETLRSCTIEVFKFIKIASNSKSIKTEIVDAFRNAVQHHNLMMNEARKGNGVDRHLFGLWCTAYENKMDIPDFFNDPLYLKSGGGGNFVLSTSILGYSPNVGFVGPMTLDGYGVFYTITSDKIFIQISSFRDSQKTSAHKFNRTFKHTFSKIRSLLDEVQKSNL